MRSISSAALATMSQAQGIEPVNLVQVFWTDTVATMYGDRKFESYGIVGRLLELSNLENVVNISKNSNTSAITIKLDDSDGSIKSIFDNNDIIKRTVYVYQWFTEVSLNDAFVIFEGEISSPIIWKEGERTITFEVLSKIEDVQYGFSAEEGNFSYIPANIIGKAWPLSFGTVDFVPALQLYNLPSGLLNNNLANTIARNNKVASLLAADLKAKAAYDNCVSKAIFCFVQREDINGSVGIADPAHSTTSFVQPSRTNTKQIAYSVADQWDLKGNEYLDQAQGYQDQRNKILQDMILMASQATAQFSVQNGATFPQGVSTDVSIGGNTYTGVFSGNDFTVLSSASPFSASSLAGPLTINDSDAATQYSATLAEQNFFLTVAGSAAISSGALSYIVSLFEVQVTGVFATYNGLLTAVPTNLYSVNYVNFGPLQATYLTMSPALSIADKLWSDTIYCSIVSPVGPNIVDIIVWLIGQYTTYGYDASSFATVRTQVSGYPAGFSLTGQGNIIKLLHDIAFQGRCALWFKEGVFYIKFLADMSSYVETISETDVEFGTLEVSCTSTEELVTKYTASYSVAGISIQSGVQVVGNNDTITGVGTAISLGQGTDLVIWYFNLQKYGLLEKKDSYFIYNITQLVERASMFWLVRYTNTWKRVKFSTFLSKLKLETFDYVLLNFANPWVSNAPVIGMVESCLYDSSNNRVELTVWLPIRFGEMVPYPFAAPYAIDPTLVFPLTFETDNAQTTNGQATGSLLPPNRTNARGGSGSQRQLTPSDTGFETPVFQSSLDASQIDTPNKTPQVSNQYVVKPVQDGSLDFLGAGTWPGIVQDQNNGNTYNVDVYFNGLAGNPSSVKVQQIRINKDDVIPTGTGVMVTRISIPGKADQGTGLIPYTVEYTMQVPVWLEDSGSGNNSGTGDPSAPTDAGTPPGEGDFSGSPALDGNSGDQPLGDF